jgi:hypothetical protein
VFSNDPNGEIFKTVHGPIVTISESLRFFLKFMHLALLEFSSDVPAYVRMNALRIAIRVMLKTEALDFLMDPRGIIPEDVGIAIHSPIDSQMEFIAGHEFAHHYLNHLADGNVHSKPIYFAISKKDTEYKPIEVYNRSQQQEFEADHHAIFTPLYGQSKRKTMLESALLWFGCLDLYETACEVLCPSNPWDYSTHPTALQRFESLLSAAPSSLGIAREEWEQFRSATKVWRQLLVEDLAIGTESYEMYGSVYLDKPNTKWRGQELIDRVDYY